MKNEINLREIASEYDLEFVETTDQSNGYPSRVMGAVTGFDSWELAEELAKKYNLDIEVITKHDGWQLWYRTGNWANEPLKITEADYGDGYKFLTADDADNYFENEVKPFLNDCETLDDVKDMITKAERITEELDKLEEAEALVLEGDEWEVINTRPMMFSYDTKNWAIALIDRNN